MTKEKKGIILDYDELRLLIGLLIKERTSLGNNIATNQFEYNKHMTEMAKDSHKKIICIKEKLQDHQSVLMSQDQINLFKG